MSESLKSKTFKGTIWSSLERFSVQGIQFIVMILMARVLTPADYGLVGMIAIFIAISQSLIDSGFSQALICKQDRSELDNSTVFFFNIGVGIVLYIALYISAPIIAQFYSEPKLIAITRVVGIGLIFNSLAVVQRALLTINLDFKTQSKASLIGAIVSGSIGITMAYTGCGVWAIVFQQIINLCLVTVLLWVFSHWKPIAAYSWTSFRELFSFGSKLLAAGLIETLYRNIYLIVIGKIFKASDLGYYTRAHQFSDFASSNITGIFQRVSFPVLCTIQDNDAKLAEIYRRILKTSAFIIFPLMTGLAALSKPIILGFLTEKWLFSTTLLVPLCFSGMWYPIHAINLNLLQVKGRSDLFLRLEIIKKIVGVIILCATIPFGLLAMCWGTVLNSLIALIINTFYTGKLINLGFFKQMADIFPTLVLSLIMAFVVYYSVYYLKINPFLQILVGLTIGVAFFSFVAKMFRFEEFDEILALVKRKS